MAKVMPNMKSVLEAFLCLLLASDLVITECEGKAKHKPRRFHMDILYVRQCENYLTNTIATIYNISVKPGKNLYLASGNIYMKKTSTPNEAIVIINRCLDQTNVNCELFHTWRFGRELCQYIEMKGMIWSSIVLAMRPKVHCPMMEGLYRFENATLDPTIVMSVFGDIILNNYWLVTLQVNTPEEKHFCVEFAVRVLPTKSQ